MTEPTDERRATRRRLRPWVGVVAALIIASQLGIATFMFAFGFGIIEPPARWQFFGIAALQFAFAAFWGFWARYTSLEARRSGAWPGQRMGSPRVPAPQRDPADRGN